MEEVVWYKADWFKMLAMAHLFLSIVSMLVNYSLIKSAKSRKLVIDWMILGYVFPVISTTILYFRIKGEQK